MLGVLLSSRSVHSGAELAFAYPHTLYQEYLSYFDTVHTNKSLSAVSVLDTARIDTKEHVLGLPCAVLGDLLCPKSELCDQVLDVTVELIRFVGFPVLTETFEDKRVKRRPSRIFGLDLSTKADTGEKLISFSVAFALDVTSDWTGMKSHQLKEAVRAFGNHQPGTYLKCEETRDGFLTKGIAKIKQIGSGKEDRESATYDAIEGCKLAQHLRDVFLNLKDAGEVRLFLNDWLDCVISINFEEEVPPLKPYQTILLLDIPQKLEEELPVDCSPVLLGLIRGLKFPIKSLGEMQLELCVSKEVVLAAAEHLIFWRKARAMSVLTQHLMIATNPAGQYTPRLEALFRNTLGKKYEKLNLDLAQVLSKFDRPRTIKDLMTTEESLKAKDCFAIVTWMLRHGLLIECVSRVFIQHSKIVDPMMSMAMWATRSVQDVYAQFLESFPKGNEYFPVLVKIVMRGRDYCDMDDLVYEEQLSSTDVIKTVAHYSEFLTLVTLVP